MPGDGKNQIAFFCLVHAIGTHIEKVSAKTLRHDRALAHQKQRKIHVVQIDQGFELRHVNILALAAVGAVKERGTDGERAMNTRIRVTKIVAHIGRRPIRLAGHGHHAALGLGDNVKAGMAGIRPVLPIA